MKFFHLSDLHIGKRLHEQPLTADQRHILSQILQLCADEKPDAVIIAGDIYDKTVPSAEAVEIFDDFLTGTAALRIPVLIISGNHDSPERLHYGSRLLAASGVYLEGTFSGAPKVITLEDEYGPVDFYLLPFVRGSTFADPEIRTEQDAVAASLAAANLKRDRRNVLISHQFVTGSIRSDSETVSVGGSDNVDAALFEEFDYAALGHLHLPQWVGKETVRYCGSPLKYSFSECSSEKSLTVVQLFEKGRVEVSAKPLVPLHDMRVIRGPIDQLTSPEVIRTADPEDYIKAVLTDEDEIASPLERLRDCYPNLLKLEFDNRRTRAAGVGDTAVSETRPLDELFADFYEIQQGRPLDESGKKLVKKLLEISFDES